MKIDEWTSEDVRNQGGGESPTCAGLASNALPEAQSIISAESSQTGVSTRNARSETMFQRKRVRDATLLSIFQFFTFAARI